MPNTPAGTWFWLHDYRAIPENWSQIVDRLHRLGATGLLVKAWDGEWRWSHQWHAEVVRIFRSEGLGIAPWGYPVGDWTGPSPDVPDGPHHACTVALDVDCATWAADMGGDFVVLDHEIEWCRQPDPDDHAHRYLSALRSRIGSTGLYSAPIMLDRGYWAGNPIATVTDFVDGFMPQVYANIWQQPEAVERFTADAFAAAHGKPVYPIYDLADNAGVSSSPEYLDSALDAALRRSASGVSYWQWSLLNISQDKALKAAAEALAWYARPQPSHPLGRTDRRHLDLLQEAERITRNGYGYLLGLPQSSGTADLSDLGDYPSDARFIEYEKAVLWTAGRGVDAMHPGQLQDLIAAGKVQRVA